VRTKVFLGLAVLLLLGLVTSLRGDDRGLEARVATLEKEVATLKARLDKLEGGAKKPERHVSRAATMEDLNSLRNLAGLVVVAEKVPMKDGALDVYAFVTAGDVTKDKYEIFRSKRLGTGPTDKEIEAGDYTNFPWERYRGDPAKLRSFRGGPRPVLWEKEPGADGKQVAAMSDGSAMLLTPEDLAAALKR